MILGVAPEEKHFELPGFMPIYQTAMDLYGLIHARFILSPKGLAVMKEKFALGHFGRCPLTACESHRVLPLGQYEALSASRVKVYCPKCKDVYVPHRGKGVDVDGAYFGASFPHVFLLTYPELVPEFESKPHIPRIYGFRIFGWNGSKYKSLKSKKRREKGKEKDRKRDFFMDQERMGGE